MYTKNCCKWALSRHSPKKGKVEGNFDELATGLFVYPCCLQLIDIFFQISVDEWLTYANPTGKYKTAVSVILGYNTDSDAIVVDEEVLNR
jgi:hypothetical protein